MLTEFKEFIAKGNVMQLAVAVIIGGAFATIVSSLTDDVIIPVVGAVFGNVDFSNKYIILSGDIEPSLSLAAARDAEANVLAWGAFVSAIINYVILAFIIFLLVRYATKVMAQFKKKEEEAPPKETGPTEVELLTEIRDALRK
jgi:large conductance mechanosensitive channel